ncbi:universal stress protein [Saccharomonospora cyanea]|uniref:Universal stress protein UspA-like protein n=1 Tax=Saccharomonospora cyanea NA-134 TaxID=882082 RepID=H5XKR8_9PSEU|nr:universal stress protein [Saccharomonospora cyanea]EHR61913.1 universal stress protein UspA-like protein [Saccharomonospora cyanea NA-134]
MTSPHSDNAPIVVGVDDTEAAMRAVRWASLTAKKHRVPLHLVHASGFNDPYLIGFTVPPPEAFKEELQERKRQALRTAEEIATEVGAPSVEARFETDAAIPFLLHASHTARMVVVGSSGRTGLAGLMVGSTTLALVSHARSPVVSVRQDYPDAVADDARPIVVGVDGSELSVRAVGHAFAEASSRGVDLIAVHTWSDTTTTLLEERRMFENWEPIHDYEAQVLAERLAGWQEEYPDVRVERKVVKDRPRHELLEHSRSAQLVVVGSRGRGGFRGMLLGSTSQALIHHASCPVMVVRPEKHQGRS